MADYLLYIIAGLAGGIIAGMGMGGGTLTIPLLTLWLKVDQKIAQSVNLIAFVPMAIVVVIIHIKNKLIDVKSLFKVAVPAVAACAVCAYYAPDISSEVLSRCFGGFLTVLGVWQIVSSVYKKIKDKKKFKPATHECDTYNCILSDHNPKDFQR